MTTVLNDTSITRRERMDSMINCDRTDVNSFYLSQALTFSLEWADAYTSKRDYEKVGMTPAAATTLAAARLEWLLRQGVQALQGVISEREFVVLCNAFQGELAVPEDYASLASPVADDNGLDPDTYQESSMGPLLDKLMGLSVLQSIALRDLVERFWYEQKNFESVEDFMKANGLTLAEE